MIQRIGQILYLSQQLANRCIAAYLYSSVNASGGGVHRSQDNPDSS